METFGSLSKHQYDNDLGRETTREEGYSGETLLVQSQAGILGRRELEESGAKLLVPTGVFCAAGARPLRPKTLKEIRRSTGLVAL